jgi:hypothetical protein
MTENKNSRIKILVCYYQPWELPVNNIFLPIQAGKEVSGFDIARWKGRVYYDNTGDNISGRNEIFGEFTAWYWAWKNIKKIYPDIEYIGLSHYRRYFVMDQPYIQHTLINKYKIPSMDNYEELFLNALGNTDIILSKPQYYSCNTREQYSYWHYKSDYECLKQVLHEMHPDYEKSFEYIFENNNGISLYCLFAAKYELFNNYFTWLFPLLFEVEKRIDASKYPRQQKRVLAFLAERLLTVYVHHHKLRADYRPLYFILGDKTKSKTKIIKDSIKAFIPYGIIKLREKIKDR